MIFEDVEMKKLINLFPKKSWASFANNFDFNLKKSHIFDNEGDELTKITQ